MKRKILYRSNYMKGSFGMLTATYRKIELNQSTKLRRNKHGYVAEHVYDEI